MQPGSAALVYGLSLMQLSCFRSISEGETEPALGWLYRQ